jgi:hypothetical protein
VFCGVLCAALRYSNAYFALMAGPGETVRDMMDMQAGLPNASVPL